MHLIEARERTRKESSMVVLRRKLDEAIVINQTITVYVLAVEGERVKLGISAPPDYSIVRQELLNAEEQQACLRRKQEALEQETDPRKRAQLAQGIKRLQQPFTLAPASLEAQQE